MIQYTNMAFKNFYFLEGECKHKHCHISKHTRENSIFDSKAFALVSFNYTQNYVAHLLGLICSFASWHTRLLEKKCIFISYLGNGRSYLQMFMKSKIKLAASEAFHLSTVLYGTKDNLPHVLGFLLVIEPYQNFCFKFYPATTTSRERHIPRETGISY